MICGPLCRERDNSNSRRDLPLNRIEALLEAEPLQQLDRTWVRARGRRLAYFSGCDYFRLSSDPRVMAALEAGMNQYGLNVAASRMTSGNHILYGRLEQALQDFFEAPSALLVSTGFMTNLVVGQALAGHFSHALIDERSHPSLAESARFLDCPTLQFKHRDPEDLRRTIARCGPGARLIVLTDGMFARDGSVAPLANYLPLLPRDALLLVDDAHAAGILGKHGRGSIEHERVSRRQIVQTVTLSKAFGAYGGAILCRPMLRARILERSTLYAGCTPLPLPLASAALKSLAILKATPSLRQRLRRNFEYLKTRLAESFSGANADPAPGPGPIIPLYLKHPNDAARLRRLLLDAKIYPPFIKYPGGPTAGFFRFVLSSEHDRAQLDALAGALIRFMRNSS